MFDLTNYVKCQILAHLISPTRPVESLKGTILRITTLATLIKSPIFRLRRPHVCQQVPRSCERMLVLLWHLLPAPILGIHTLGIGTPTPQHIIKICMDHMTSKCNDSQLCNIRIQIKVLAVSPALTIWWSWNLQTNHVTIQRMLLRVWGLSGPTCSLSCWELLMIRTVISCGGYSGTTG